MVAFTHPDTKLRAYRPPLIDRLTPRDPEQAAARWLALVAAVAAIGCFSWVWLR